MKRCTERRGLGGLVLGAILAAGTNQCVTDHDALAKRDRSGGAAGMSGSGGRAGSGSGSGGTEPDGTGGKYLEAPGSNVVTFMNGVVDSERVTFCFARERDGSQEFVAEPAPASGLDFGHSFHVESLPELDIAEDVFTPYVIGGDLELLDGLDCEHAVALAQELMQLALPEEGSAGAPNAEGGAGGAGGDSDQAPAIEQTAGAGGAGPVALPDPPALRVRALPALPAGTLSGGYSYLLVAEGCLGGPWYVGKNDDEICGPGYSGDTTLTPTLVVMSREPSLNVGLQALNASRASGPLSAVVSPPPDNINLPVSIANELVDGKLAPIPALVLFSKYEYGLSDPATRVRFVDSEGEECAVSWDDLLERGGLSALENGQNYVLVALGPRVGLGATSFGNSPTIGIAAAEPELQ